MEPTIWRNFFPYPGDEFAQFLYQDTVTIIYWAEYIAATMNGTTISRMYPQQCLVIKQKIAKVPTGILAPTGSLPDQT